MNPGTAGGGGADRGRRRQSLHDEHPCRARLPHRQQRDHGEQRHPRRARAWSATTWCSAASPPCTSSCARPRRDDRRARRRRRRRHPLRLGGRRAGAPRGPQPRRAQAARRGAWRRQRAARRLRRRCSRARARSRSGCGASASASRAIRWCGRSSTSSPRNPRGPSPSRRADAARCPAPGWPSSPGGASCRGCSPRTAPRGAGPTASWCSTGSRSTGSAAIRCCRRASSGRAGSSPTCGPPDAARWSSPAA